MDDGSRQQNCGRVASLTTCLWMGAVLSAAVVAQQNCRAQEADPNTTRARIEGEHQLEVTVGMSGKIEQVVLPGSRLTTKDVDPRKTPIVVRIDGVFPHGENHRYDLTWFGLEPGEHNLSRYLAREDGSAADDLPAIPVVVNSVLPADRQHPNELSTGLLARIGGYRVAVILSIVVWIVGLLLILFVGRSRSRHVPTGSSEGVQTPVDHIRSLIDRALDAGELSTTEKADLDMRILNFFRERRDLEGAPIGEALTVLKNDAEAGPLLTGLERWFYSRHPPDRDEVSAMLQPLIDLTQPDTAAPSAAAASATGGSA